MKWRIEAPTFIYKYIYPTYWAYYF